MLWGIILISAVLYVVTSIVSNICNIVKFIENIHIKRKLYKENKL